MPLHRVVDMGALSTLGLWHLVAKDEAMELAVKVDFQRRELERYAKFSEFKLRNIPAAVNNWPNETTAAQLARLEVVRTREWVNSRLENKPPVAASLAAACLGAVACCHLLPKTQKREGRRLRCRGQPE